jgi:ketosteroid isomerase-like protein
MALADAVESPPDVCHRFATAISRGQLDAAVRCLTRDVCLITPDATAIHGRLAVRQVIAQLIERRARVEVRLAGLLIADDVALAHETWLIHSEPAGLEEFVQPTSPTSVLRLVEGGWKLAITAPWGLRGGSLLQGRPGFRQMSQGA